MKKILIGLAFIGVLYAFGNEGLKKDDTYCSECTRNDFTACVDCSGCSVVYGYAHSSAVAETCK